MQTDIQLLQPLLDRLRQYDTSHQEFLDSPDRLSTVEQLTDILKKPICFESSPGKESFALTEPSQLRTFLRMRLSDLIVLDTRKDNLGFPVYYLSRLASNDRTEYDIILENLHVSNTYPFEEKQLVRLIRNGHELYHIHLAGFRNQVKSASSFGSDINNQKIDDFLIQLGSHCLGAMWHEEQIPARICAREFNLPCFMQAVELLYLCLGADLCELRSHVTEEMIGFFTECYPQPTVSKFLQSLHDRSGYDINQLPTESAENYKKLSYQFQKMLQTNISWQSEAISSDSQMNLSVTKQSLTLPLYKLLFANLYRFDSVIPYLNIDDKLLEAVESLEKQAQQVIAQLTHSDMYPG